MLGAIPVCSAKVQTEALVGWPAWTNASYSAGGMSTSAANLIGAFLGHWIAPV